MDESIAALFQFKAEIEDAIERAGLTNWAFAQIDPILMDVEVILSGYAAGQLFGIEFPDVEPDDDFEQEEVDSPMGEVLTLDEFRSKE